tara:strand:- start:3000 stop:3251 length:252 start_codon:yes stop_codon:yes gene_type:complete
MTVVPTGTVRSSRTKSLMSDRTSLALEGAGWAGGDRAGVGADAVTAVGIAVGLAAARGGWVATAVGAAVGAAGCDGTGVGVVD